MVVGGAGTVAELYGMLAGAEDPLTVMVVDIVMAMVVDIVTVMVGATPMRLPPLLSVPDFMVRLLIPMPLH